MNELMNEREMFDVSPPHTHTTTTHHIKINLIKMPRLYFKKTKNYLFFLFFFLNLLLSIQIFFFIFYILFFQNK